MFEEQYRRDNEHIHAPDSLYLDIQRQARRAAKKAAVRRSFVRYGSAAAVLLLVCAGLLSGIRTPEKEMHAADQAVAAPMAVAARTGDAPAAEAPAST